MKTKFLIPVLAMIFAVGMSFTTVDLGDPQGFDYIRENNNWSPISEIDCGPTGQKDCKVLYNNNVHKVYDTMNIESIKRTSSDKPFEH